MADDRPLRICDICFQVDTDPRHQIAAVLGAPDFDPVPQDVIDRITYDESLPLRARMDAVRSLDDRSQQIAHMDCCADSGRCPDGTCRAQLDAAGGNSAKLVTHLLNQHAKLNDEHAKAGRA